MRGHRFGLGETTAQINGARVFAGARWDPFIMDAPAAINTIETGQLAFKRPKLDFP